MMPYEFRTKVGTFPLVEVTAEEMMERLAWPIVGVPICWARLPHRRPDTKELTGVSFAHVWPYPFAVEIEKGDQSKAEMVGDLMEIE